MIRYTSFSPADVVVDYRLLGGRGSLKLGGGHQRFAKRGLLRVTEKLSDAEMEKVRAARRFTVSMAIPEAPRYCRRYDTRHLTIKRTVHSQVVWFQSDSIFGSQPSATRTSHSVAAARSPGVDLVADVGLAVGRPRGRPPRAARGRGGRSRPP